MGLYNGAVITSAGQNLLAQAISGTELTWTAMRASSVAIPEGTDLTTLTALTGIKQTAVITDSSVYGSNVVQVSARFSNTGIDTAYLMETIGIYGQVAGGSETLIAVMTAETPDEMPVYDQDSPSAFIFNAQMSIQNANSLTMTVSDTGTATVADLNRKVNLNGGDLSDTVVDTFTAAAAEYPVPAAGDTMKVIGGKIAKFFRDIKAAYTNVSVSGKKITFTTAAGDTKEITTQDTTYSDFTKATASAAGVHGLVPAPAAGKQEQFLRGDATWAYLPLQNNATTTAEHYALDARMGKTLNDRITSEHINREVITFDLDAATWTQTPQGKYITTVKKYELGNFVLGVTLGTIGNLRATDVVQPYMAGDGGRTINIMSNTKSFANASANVQIYIMYRPA
jgi:hypothetical protein